MATREERKAELKQFTNICILRFKSGLDVGGLTIPFSDESAIDHVPLLGIGERPKKFFLGKLVRHRGKTVDDVIQQSIHAGNARRVQMSIHRGDSAYPT